MAQAVGIDLGGTKVSGGLVDGGGRLVRRVQTPSTIGTPERLRRVVCELVSELLGTERPDAVGVGAAGIIDYDAGRYLFGPNTGLRDVDLRALLSDALDADVRLDNDGNCAAWAEHRFGAGRGTGAFLCVTLGTGIGGGIVVDGRPYRGAHGGAAEIGHMVVEADGVLCGCGRRGCWEQYASGRALERLAREGLPSAPDSSLNERGEGGPPATLRGPMVTAAAREGDPFALDVLRRVARWVGLGLGSLVNVLEPERIAISGGVVEDWDLLSEEVRDTMRDRVEAPEHRPLPEVVPAELGTDAGIVGAALLVLEPDIHGG